MGGEAFATAQRMIKRAIAVASAGAPDGTSAESELGSIVLFPVNGCPGDPKFTYSF